MQTLGHFFEPLYTTWLFSSPESYSLNVLVGNLQLPNNLCSSGGMDRFHRPAEKIISIDSISVKVPVPSCKMPRGHLPFVA